VTQVSAPTGTAPQLSSLRGQGVRGVVVTESYLKLQLDPDAAPEKSNALGYLFGEFSERTATSASPERMVDLMDELGIRRAQFSIPVWSELEFGRKLLEQYPERFAASIRVDPHEGSKLLRRIEAAHRDLPGLLTSVSVLPFAVNPPVPPDDKHFYPLYSKCEELGLPININVGIPGPRQRGRMQDPIYLDEVCFDFPGLTIVMRHGGDPWADVCAKLMLKWPNLYYCTDKWAPKHYRPEILEFANTRGADRVIYGGCFPELSYERIFRELAALPLREHVWEPFLSGNAQRVYGL
jgi:predicted TIM-barrel fold metal-dependent hydrolase